MTPHRQTTYRVEQTTRALTAKEKEDVETRARDWRARRLTAEEANPKIVLGAIVVVAFLGLVFGVMTTTWPFVIGGFVGFVLANVYWWVTVPSIRARVAKLRCDWEPKSPGASWQVCETIIRARSLVATASGDEDYMEWWLFEIPGGEWFFLDPVMLPHEPFEAREEIRLVTLHPEGPCLSSTSRGDPLPRRGMPVDDYAKGVASGCVWRPERLIAMGTIAERSLPAWVRSD